MPLREYFGSTARRGRRRLSLARPSRNCCDSHEHACAHRCGDCRTRRAECLSWSGNLCAHQSNAAFGACGSAGPAKRGRPEALTNVPPSVPPSPWDNTNIQLRFSAAWARSATFFRCGPQFLWSKRELVLVATARLALLLLEEALGVEGVDGGGHAEQSQGDKNG